MHILIKTLTGKTCSLNFEKTASIDNVYSQVEKVMGVPTEEQNLIFKGKSLESGKLLLDYEMGDEENVYLVVLKVKRRRKMLRKERRNIKRKKSSLQF